MKFDNLIQKLTLNNSQRIKSNSNSIPTRINQMPPNELNPNKLENK